MEKSQFADDFIFKLELLNLPIASHCYETAQIRSCPSSGWLVSILIYWHIHIHCEVPTSCFAGNHLLSKSKTCAIVNLWQDLANEAAFVKGSSSHTRTHLNMLSMLLILNRFNENRTHSPPDFVGLWHRMPILSGFRTLLLPVTEVVNQDEEDRWHLPFDVWKSKWSWNRSKKGGTSVETQIFGKSMCIYCVQWLRGSGLERLGYPYSLLVVSWWTPHEITKEIPFKSH